MIFFSLGQNTFNSIYSKDYACPPERQYRVMQRAQATESALSDCAILSKQFNPLNLREVGQDPEKTKHSMASSLWGLVSIKTS